MVVNHVQRDINAIPQIISIKQNVLEMNIKTIPARAHVKYVGPTTMDAQWSIMPVWTAQRAHFQTTVTRVTVAPLRTVNIQTKSNKRPAKVVTKQSRRVRTTDLIIPTATFSVSAILRASVVKTVKLGNIRWS